MRTAFRVVLVITLLGPFLDAGRAHAQTQSQPSQQETDDVIRVTTTLVTLPVRVTDRHGKYVPGLTREQFQIFEDGVEQEIAYFEAGSADASPTSLPLTVALLLDVSDSTEFKLEQIQNTAITFLDLLRPSDRVIVVAFDKGVRVLTLATENRDVLRRAIRGTQTGGGTSLYQALVSTIKLLNRTSGRKAIILLTDGVDTSSKDVTWEMVLRETESSHIAIHPIQYHTLGDFSQSSTRETYAVGEFGRTAHVTKGGEPASEAYRRATRYLRMLADKTSGHFQYSDKASNLARSFERLATELRQQYTIGYYPKNKTSAGTRKVRVRVNQRDVKISTRNSYTYRIPSSQN